MTTQQPLLNAAKSDRVTTYAWLIVLCNASFLFYKYILQLFPSVMVTPLMQTFHLHGVGLGNLVATYFYSFFLAQLVSGYLLDRYSPRVVTTLAMVVCALGTLAFAHAHSLLVAELSRALIGVGVAFATVSYLKQIAVWFPPHRIALAGGLLASAVGVGALIGQAPLAHCVAALGWRTTLTICGLLGFVIAAVYVVLVQDKPCDQRDHESSVMNLSHIKQVLKNKRNWLLACYSGFAFSPLAVFGGLWGNPFLQQTFHLNNMQAAKLITLAFVGLGVGAPLLGYWADRWNRRMEVMIAATALSGVSLLMVLLLPGSASVMLAVSLFTFGFGTGGFMLGFAVAKTLNPIMMAATVIAMINTGDALFGAITEPLIGAMLDHLSQGRMVNGVPVFTAHQYHQALSILPVYILISIVCALLASLSRWRDSASIKASLLGEG